MVLLHDLGRFDGIINHEKKKIKMAKQVDVLLYACL